MRTRLWLYWTVFGTLAVGGYFLVPTDIWPSNAYYDAIGLTSAVMILIGVRIMRPLVSDVGLTGPEKLVLLAYPAGDVLLIAMVARLFTTPGARTLSYRLLMAGLVLTLAADISYAYVVAIDVYDGGLMDAGWLLSYVAWGAAALHPSMRSLSETAPDRAARLTGRRLGLLTATSLLAPAILIHQGLTDPRNIDWLAASIGAVALFLLVLARMSGLVAQVQDQAAQLDALAHNDALTGVPNRRAWDLELARHLANFRRRWSPGRRPPPQGGGGHLAVPTADEALYRAKHAGRSRIVVDDAESVAAPAVLPVEAVG